jgi:hypothetical protein
MASVIRTGLGVGTKYKPSELSQGVLELQNAAFNVNKLSNAIVYHGSKPEIIGPKMYPGMFAGSSIKTYEVPEIFTEIPRYAFTGSAINNIKLHDNITAIGDEAFYNCESLINIELPKNLLSIGMSAFGGYSAILPMFYRHFVIPKSVTSIGTFAFTGFGYGSIDLLCAAPIPAYCFWLNVFMDTLILRNETGVCTLVSTSALESTRIASGSGYIYVPSALIEEYKTATNWSTFAAQFRALEDYTVDGTVTGKLDKNKI